MVVHTARIGDIIIGRAPDVLEALALGSCVSAAIYDPEFKIGALTHILLPESSQFREIDKLGKYADTAIPEAIRQLTAKGANRDRLIAKIAGGAKMFEMTGVSKSTIDVGSRNIEATKGKLKELNIPIVAQDVGENYGRTIQFNLETFTLTIKLGLKKITRHI